MANICYNEIIFFGEKENLKSFYEKLSEYKTETKDNSLYGFGIHIGYLSEQLPRCGGEFEILEEYQEDMSQFQLNATTRWRPVDSYWDMISKHFNLNYASRSTECGHDIYVIHNDEQHIYFPDNILLDIWDNDEETGLTAGDYLFFMNESAVEKYLNENSSKNLNYDEWKILLNENSIFGRINEFQRD